MVRKLPYKIFVESFKYVPRVAVNLLLKKKGGEFLLTKRAIPPEKNSWHLPGSFLLKGEKLLDCAKRVGRDELGLAIDVKKLKLLGIFDDTDKDPRGHIVDIIYGYEVERTVKLKPGRDTKEIKFFGKIPRVVFAHLSILRELGYE